ncbi:MAG: phosphoribosylformylglycinamidine synthase [Nitrospirae bacterium]|nr:phosphoribosylformylglycinamidine synthase [Nitrospirota bacterium]
MILHFYRRPAISQSKKNNLLSVLKQETSPHIEDNEKNPPSPPFDKGGMGGFEDIETEHCFNVETKEPLTNQELKILNWLLSETFEPENFSERSFLADSYQLSASVVEVGPRMNFTTAWSTNAVAVCHACGLTKINHIERSRRYKFIFSKQGSEDKKLRKWEDEKSKFLNLPTSQLQSLLLTLYSSLFYDRMTECPYPEPLITFETGIKPEPVYEIPLIEEGESALVKINQEMGLGLDEWDIDYYYNLFVNELHRNPTNVECFDLSQSNSEHSRHWFFKGRLIIDSAEIPYSLIDIIKQPLKTNPKNSVIAFRDNSSVIRGYEINTILPEFLDKPSALKKTKTKYHLIFTAETHNFPTAVAPFPGAETGTGGRIRDVQATGRGGLVIAGTAAYCVGNLLIPGYEQPWEDRTFPYPTNLAAPLEIEIQASNGASDYGNKFGEPVIQGFTRSFGMRLPNGERSEWIKPIMFTGGIGQIDFRHIEKGSPEKGMLVIKVGGPAYRIGIGGGSASSMIQGENLEELDFNAVQRGDAEMEQKLNRVIRACVELGDRNPIVSIHDQGAGGNCNVVKEIIYPAGAKIEIRRIRLGDNTLSVLEIWGAEYQEQNALLIKKEDIGIFQDMCLREKVPCDVIGDITGDGIIVLYDEKDKSTPVNLNLEKVLGDMPQKTFHLQRIPIKTQPLKFPWDLTDTRHSSLVTRHYIKDALERVLRLLSVGSKRFLTNKVDRSVTGLIARQQCVGPLQLTLSNVAVIAQSHFGLTGSAISIGEQPIKGLINPSAMARISVGEALTNIVWAKISALEDIKCSGNWMWAAKLPGEGARLYDAAAAMRDIMIELGIAVDGGKDSVSMAAQVKDVDGKAEIVKSPGTLVISAYAPCPDITKVITPDIKMTGQSKLLFIDLGKGKNRMGGSALAHVYNQIGDESPDVDDPHLLKHTFNAVQLLISKDLILSGHDRSDGGLITTLLEMAFAGNCGMEIEINQNTEHRTQNTENPPSPPFDKGGMGGFVLPLLFSEELGLAIEYLPEKEDEVFSVLKNFSVPYQIIGRSLAEKRIKINLVTRHSACPEPDEGSLVTIMDEDMRDLRKVWEETSYRLDRLQANPECVEEEREINYDRKGPNYILTFTPVNINEKNPPSPPQPPLSKGGLQGGKREMGGFKVAIIREEGSNSDREMASAFYQAGFEPWDITMTDLLSERINLKDFRGIAFVGGFSYADVLDSAKGWAGVIRFNEKIWEQFQEFYQRENTFSLGVCNGCQLMALLGWVPWQSIENTRQPRFIHNRSGRFESRFSTVKILSSPSIMLKDMEGSVLGVWVAHGEGRTYSPDEKILKDIENRGLAPVRYVDDNNEIAIKYPFNPNGSVSGIAALCSSNGRHLAIMPHPERAFLKWQWGWMPEKWKIELKISPWLKIFQNARQWCE